MVVHRLGGWVLAWLFGCVGVVCELDSVFVFCFYACFLFLSIFLVGIACLCGGFSGLNVFTFLFGEFDPGSGRTLAACLTHASRTVKHLPFGGCG